MSPSASALASFTLPVSSNHCFSRPERGVCIVITLRGQRYAGHGKNVLGDPRVALTWLANELRGLGIPLRAGEVVTTGIDPLRW